ncbi:MAG: PIG-L family deacetylase [Mariniblastus sp.]|nr:PIG-L family deacetylase [Mariniblastus sp.]
MEADPEGLDVIAVGAHPDDVEIGCGGTLARLVQQGLRVGVVDLTDGEPTPGSPSPQVRLAEAEAAANVLGVKRVVLDLPNRRLFDSFEARVLLACQFRKYRPRVVLGLHGKTPMASPDHFQASQITDAAVFYSRLTKWDEHFDGLPVHTIGRQVYYSLSFELSVTGTSGHPFVYDIGETLEKKLESIRCYQTQFPPAKQYVLDRVRALAEANGAGAGFQAGEVLFSTRAIGSTDLMQTLFPSP